MIEAGSKINWFAFWNPGVADKDLFLLRAEDPGRHTFASGRRRRRAVAAATTLSACAACATAFRSPPTEVRCGGVVGEEPVTNGALRVSLALHRSGEILTVYGFGAGRSYTSGFTLNSWDNVMTSLNGAQVFVRRQSRADDVWLGFTKPTSLCRWMRGRAWRSRSLSRLAGCHRSAR